MALEYSFDASARLIRIVGRGAVSVESRVHLVRGLLGDTALPAVASVLIDVSEVTNAPDADDVRTIGMLIERMITRFRGRVAVVTASVGHVTLSHLVSLSVGDGVSGAQSFTSQSAARAWLES